MKYTVSYVMTNLVRASRRLLLEELCILINLCLSGPCVLFHRSFKTSDWHGRGPKPIHTCFFVTMNLVGENHCKFVGTIIEH